MHPMLKEHECRTKNEVTSPVLSGQLASTDGHSWPSLDQSTRTQNQEPRTKNQEPRTKNQEPRTKNQEPMSLEAINSAAHISVIIPTRDRPALVGRAINSVLSQTYGNLEVVVVLDGADPSTEEAVEAIGDPRVRHITLPVSGGVARARNFGVQQATGKWVAFLDDDDEWLPTKLETQLRLAQDSGTAWVVVGSRYLCRSQGTDFLWPRRLPQELEDISEYLFVRKSWFRGDGNLLTSTIFTSRELAGKYPFPESCLFHEDWKWVLIVMHDPAVQFVVTPEPLAIWNDDPTRRRLSYSRAWQESLRWLYSVQHLMTRRAFSFFIATIIVPSAVASRSISAFPTLLGVMLRYGSRQPKEVILFLCNWFIPRELRRRLRTVVDHSRQNGRAECTMSVPRTPVRTAAKKMLNQDCRREDAFKNAKS